MLPCVILAGGLGTRMRPRTDRVPKALLEVAGRPFADLQLAWLRSEGIDHVVYSIGFLGERIREHVGDGSQHQLHVDYVDEGPMLLGTGGALRLVVDSGLIGEGFFVTNGDSYLTIDLADVERHFAASGASALMTVLRNRNRWESSNVIVADERVALFDKSRPSSAVDRMEWIDYGISVLHSRVIRERVAHGAVADMADIMRDLSIAGEVAAYEAGERFYEIGSPAGLRDLEEHLGNPGRTTT